MANSHVPSDRINRVWSKLKHLAVTHDNVKEVVEAFAEDLSENPIVPTIEQLKAINAAWHEGNHLALGTGETSFVLIEFQRRMFLAPPEPTCSHTRTRTYPNFVNALDAVTGIKTPPTVTICLDCGEPVAAPEPEIPPEIEDLLWGPKGCGDEELRRYDEKHDADLIEAFNRGRRVGKGE